MVTPGLIRGLLAEPDPWSMVGFLCPLFLFQTASPGSGFLLTHLSPCLLPHSGDGGPVSGCLSLVLFAERERIGGTHVALLAGAGRYFSLLPDQSFHKYLLSTYSVPGTMLGAIAGRLEI